MPITTSATAYTPSEEVDYVGHTLPGPATIDISLHDHNDDDEFQDTAEYVEEPLSIEDGNRELIRKALVRNKGKRKLAAQELKISERTLYRKIKEYNLEEL